MSISTNSPACKIRFVLVFRGGTMASQICTVCVPSARFPDGEVVAGVRTRTCWRPSPGDRPRRRSKAHRATGSHSSSPCFADSVGESLSRRLRAVTHHVLIIPHVRCGYYGDVAYVSLPRYCIRLEKFFPTNCAISKSMETLSTRKIILRT